ncbi:MAG: hypothetical protein ACI4HQ_04420 [Acetatifactor sp.]
MSKSNSMLWMRLFTLFLYFCLVNLTGCANTNKEQSIAESPSIIEGERFWINQYVPTEGKRVFTIENTESGLYRFCCYENKRIIREKIAEDTYEGFYYDTARKVFYSYNKEKKQLEILNLEFEPIDILVSDLELFEIKNMVGIDAEIYALIVPENPLEKEEVYSDVGEGDYLDFGEQLIAINPISGEMRQIEMENPICITQGEKGLLIYAYQQGEYRLFSYDTVKGESSVLETMNDVGYIFAMAYRDNCIYYTGNLYPGFWKRDMMTGENTCLNEEAVIVKDADLYVINKSLYMLDHFGGEIYRY